MFQSGFDLGLEEIFFRNEELQYLYAIKIQKIHGAWEAY